MARVRDRFDARDNDGVRLPRLLFCRVAVTHRAIALPSRVRVPLLYLSLSPYREQAARRASRDA